jgi:hypothetical protein
MLAMPCRMCLLAAIFKEHFATNPLPQIDPRADPAGL